MFKIKFMTENELEKFTNSPWTWIGIAGMIVCLALFIVVY